MLYERYTSILEFTILSTDVYLENSHFCIVLHGKSKNLRFLLILTLQGLVLLCHNNFLSTKILYGVSRVFLEFIHLLRFAEITNLSFTGREWKGREWDGSWQILSNWFGSIPHLLVQSQQWKDLNNVCNLINVKNKETWTTLMTRFWCLYC